ncbi:MAG: exodeoxyribonuclease V subunit gamma, partial [Candidatus Eisenbacteria sp.]|nr:exodeoxyribonuclease V subunit gamma [Candidatus Eisenbacteria bacterium]
PLVELLTGSLSPVAAKTTISEFLDLLLGVFCEVTRESSERSEVLTAASEMRSLSDVAGPVTFAYFMELLRSHLDSPSRRSERFGRGGPSVLNVMAARGLRFGTVIIPGLVEKKFPATHRQDPVLLDSERERLNRARGDDPLAELAIRASAVDEERLLFRLAVESAADALILSFPRLDPADARPRVPSVFVLRALEEKTGERHDYERLEASEHVTRVPLSLRFPDERGRSLTREEFDGCSVLAALRTGDLSEISYLVQEDGPLPRRLRMEEARWGSPFFTEYDAAFTSQDAIRAVRELSGFGRGGMQEHQTVAPTTLEDYARCPFRFLMRHVLDIEPVSEPEEALALSPLERGSLYHEVLETFMRRAKAENRLPLVASDRDDLLATARRLGESEQWSLAAIRGARDLETGNLISSLALWFASELLDDSPYVPAHFEARFGGHARPGDDPELSIEDGVPFTGAGGVDLRFGGRIDRVDVTADGARARVIDYKTGKPRSKGKKVLDRGKLLQLPIYLLAAERMLKLHGAGATVETAEYLYVSGRGGPSSLTFTREELENARENLARAVGLIMGGIASGMFVAYPPDLSDCRHCDYADACGSAAVALATMKSGDPLAAFFVQDLTEIE